MDQSFAGFAAAVESTVNRFAKSKGYTTEGGESGNVACEVLKIMGINFPHKIGEIVYKCVEFMHSPRRVILEKIAGTAYILWRDTGTDWEEATALELGAATRHNGLARPLVTPAADTPAPSLSSSER